MGFCQRRHLLFHGFAAIPSKIFFTTVKKKDYILFLTCAEGPYFRIENGRVYLISIK